MEYIKIGGRAGIDIDKVGNIIIYDLWYLCKSIYYCTLDNIDVNRVPISLNY